MSSASVSDRLAVITGASAGIGRELARRLAGSGWTLVLGARRTERLEALAEELGGCAHVAPLDVRDKDSVARFCARALELAGTAGIAALVNNAGLSLGVAHVHEATEADEHDWETVFDTNLTGLLRVTRRLLPHMVAAGRGHVLNMGSLAGIEPYEGGAVYCASKAGVRALSRSLRFEVLGSGVRVSCVNPGMVETEFSEVRLGDADQARAVYQGLKPLSGDDVAGACAWLLEQPEHVNIEELWLQPVHQGSPGRVHRQ